MTARLVQLVLFLVFLIPLSARSETCEAIPVIGISGDGPTSANVMPLVASVQMAGGKVRYLEQVEGHSPVSDLPILDGLIIAHNNRDIHPIRYNQEPHSTTRVEQDPLRAQYEYQIIDLALKAELPLLAINGGMLRLAVSGPPDERGSIFQNIRWQDQTKSKPSIPLYVATEMVDLQAGSFMASLSPLFEEPLKVNSHHHQAPNRLRKGFHATAFSERSTIEAMEPHPKGKYAEQFAIGIMWHPEYAADPVSVNLLNAFVEKAKNFACDKL